MAIFISLSISRVRPRFYPCWVKTMANEERKWILKILLRLGSARRVSIDDYIFFLQSFPEWKIHPTIRFERWRSQENGQFFFTGYRTQKFPNRVASGFPQIINSSFPSAVYLFLTGIFFLLSKLLRSFPTRTRAQHLVLSPPYWLRFRWTAAFWNTYFLLFV